jgi:MOSC domain-containing protein YiiM
VTGGVLSVNVGTAEANPARRGRGRTGFGKRPVEAAELRAPGSQGSGVVGDFIGGTGFHGGDGKAVYAFAREELDLWEERLGRSLPPGAFAENLTTTGIDVDGGRIGDRWAVGDQVVLEVTAPRTPCRTFSHRLGVTGWMRTFAEHGRPGAYLRVVQGGTVRQGDWIVVTASEGAPLREVFRAVMGLDDLVR